MPGGLAGLVELEEGEERDRFGEAIGAAHGVVEPKALCTREQASQVSEPGLDRHVGPGHVAEVELRRVAQQAADRFCQQLGPVGGLRGLYGQAAQGRRQGRRAVAVAGLGGQALFEVLGRHLVAAVLEHPGEQLLGGFPRLDVEALGLLGGQHEPRLELEQGGDQQQELCGGLQIELARALEVIDVGDYHVEKLDLQQIHLLAKNEGEQKVEGPVEDLQVELEGGDRHAEQTRTARGQNDEGTTRGSDPLSQGHSGGLTPS